MATWQSCLMPVGKRQWLFFLLTSIASISVAVPNKKTKDVKQYSAVSGAEQRGTYDVDPNPFTAVDFRPLEDNMDRWFAQFRSGGHGVGENSFFPGHNTSIYGAADTLMSLVVLGREDELTEADRDAFASVINRFQDPSTGLYLAQDFEPHFGPTLPLGCCDHEHTTAFAVASLFLIDRRPLYPLTAFEALQDNTSMWEGWLSDTPAQGGWDHRAAAVHAALAMTGKLDQNFSSFYFSWLDSHADETTGFVCPHEVKSGAQPAVGWMTCYAHISWQYVYANRSWPHATRMVDATLAMQNASTGWFCVSPGGASECSTKCAGCTSNGCCGSSSPVLPSCHQLDGLWVAARSSAVAGRYRHGDIDQMCRRFLTAAGRVLADSNGSVLFNRDVYGDTHGLNGALQAIAECARWFPDDVITHRPWRITVDTAPFM